MLRVALLYPPPWKIPDPGQATDTGRDGPPPDYREGDLDPDFHQTPYGLFTLGAQTLHAGHRAKVINLSGFAWSELERVVRELDADVFAMSCWTANRRGVALVADLVKQLHPSAHVVIGGPHATPLAKEMLTHHASIDTVVCGEGELTFLELLERVEAKQPMDGLAGAWVRTAAGIQQGPERASIKDLDDLESPHDWFDTHIVMTSRGCPWQCTFCGAETSWGRGFRAQSIDYVVDSLASALERVPVKMIQIKDDTFTTNKKRVVDLCRAMRAADLNFLWSCDTRVDVLTEELLREMRLAGCQRLSLGVESGSQRILDAINKKITVDEIVEATEMAKRVGIQVRYYMMLGNRGETEESFRETLAFLERSQPHQYLFSCLSIYPGTLDFQDAKAEWLDPELYFSETFQELKTPFDASPEDAALMSAWFAENHGVRVMYQPSSADCRAVIERLGEPHAGAQLDLAAALFREGEPQAAWVETDRALALRHPTPGLVRNLRACIAFARGDVEAMKDEFLQAAKADPQHAVLIENVQRTRAWFAANGPERGLPLDLDPRHDFALFERNVQPTLPGPLPEGWSEWTETPRRRTRPPRQASSGKRLRVVSAP